MYIMLMGYKRGKDARKSTRMYDLYTKQGGGLKVIEKIKACIDYSEGVVGREAIKEITEEEYREIRIIIETMLEGYED